MSKVVDAHPVIIYLRADCPDCGRRWHFLIDPVRNLLYGGDADYPGSGQWVMTGPDMVCPSPDCQRVLEPWMATLTADGAWLPVADTPQAALN